MKIIRNVSIVLFVLSAALFGYYMRQELYEKDHTGPVFSVDNYLVTVSVKDDEKALLKGITARDATDGDVSNSIIVESVGPFTGYSHRAVNYVAVDSDNHVVHKKRELVYSDYISPRFHLRNPLSFPLNTKNVLQGVTAEDCLDGNVTRRIRMVTNEQIDTSYIGEYDVRLKVTNSAGGISYLPVTISIYDEKVEMGRPQLNLTDYLVYLEKDSDFDPQEYMKNCVIGSRAYTFVEKGGTYGVEIDTKKMSKERQKELKKVSTMDSDYVEISGEVDTSTTGFYRVKYFFHDDEDEDVGTAEVTLYVVVTDEKVEDREDGKYSERESSQEQEEQEDEDSEDDE